MSNRRSRTVPSLGPLTTTPAFNPDTAEEDNGPFTPRTSYLSGRSAPTTPGILSRSASGRNLAGQQHDASSRSYTHLAFADFTQAASGNSGTAPTIPKSKSTIGFAPGSDVKPSRRKKSVQLTSQAQQAGDPEWLFRAAAAISSDARETKGQSWLVNRASSTSLVALDRPSDDEDENEGSRPASGSRTPIAHHQRNASSRAASRAASRVASRAASRAPSARGSRADLAALQTPTWRSSMEKEDQDDYFGGASATSRRGYDGPDFVDDFEEDYGGVRGRQGPEGGDDDEGEDSDSSDGLDEEREVASLAQYRGFGLGSVVDRLIGWTLFEVPDDGGEDDDEDLGVSAAAVTPQARSRRSSLQHAHQKRPETPSATTVKAAPAANLKAAPPLQTAGSVPQQGQGWRDAAWLLTVAANVLF